MISVEDKMNGQNKPAEVCKTTARVFFDLDSIVSITVVGKKPFVRVIVQAKSGGNPAGELLYINDQRPESVAAAEKLSSSNCGLMCEELVSVLNRPATVQINKVTGQNSEYHFVNLFVYRADSICHALFAASMYKMHDTNCQLDNKKPMFLWSSRSLDKAGTEGDIILVALTTKTRSLTVCQHIDQAGIPRAFLTIMTEKIFTKEVSSKNVAFSENPRRLLLAI